MHKISEIRITYNPHKLKEEEMKSIISSGDSWDYLKSIWSDKIEYIEEVYLLLLNTSNKVIGYSRISMGGMNTAIVDPKVVFQTALKSHAAGFFLAHNHPSGSLKPSQQDLALTKRIMEGANILDISLLDHLILTKSGYISFADQGLL